MQLIVTITIILLCHMKLYLQMASIPRFAPCLNMLFEQSPTRTLENILRLIKFHPTKYNEHHGNMKIK